MEEKCLILSPFSARVPAKFPQSSRKFTIMLMACTSPQKCGNFRKCDDFDMIFRGNQIEPVNGRKTPHFEHFLSPSSRKFTFMIIAFTSQKMHGNFRKCYDFDDAFCGN